MNFVDGILCGIIVLAVLYFGAKKLFFNKHQEATSEFPVIPPSPPDTPVDPGHHPIDDPNDPDGPPIHH